MITDNGLRIATAEVLASHGSTAPTISAQSAALNLDPGGLTAVLRNYSDIGAGQRLMINVNVDTTLTSTSVVFPETFEFQLISLPMDAAAVLDEATTIGRDLFVAAVAGTVATDIFTLVGHGLPLGAPIHLSTFSGLPDLETVLKEVVYYVVPETVDTFKIATTLANALIGTTIVITGVDGTVTMNVIPTVHASSGGLEMFDAPSNKSPLQAGRQIQIPIRPLPGMTPKQAAPTSQAAVPIVDEVTTPLGAGPGADLIAANSQRFYYLLYKASAAITAGTVTVDIVVDAGDERKYYGSGFQVIG